MHSKTRASFVFAMLAVCLTVTGAQAQVINEWVFNHTGTDTDEFIEIFGDADTDYSNLTIVEIEGDFGTAAGTIDSATTVGTTDANGYWSTGFLENDLENGSITILLVDGFTGTVGDDLDADDDGVLDTMPWTSVVDDFAVLDADDETVYSDVVLAELFDGQPFEPGGASRIPNGVDTDTIADWTRNDFDGAGLPCCDPGTPENGEAVNTPEAENEAIVVAGPVLEITGSCPGDITIAFTDGTASATVGLLLGGGLGTDPIPGGPCVGVESGLSGLSLLTLLTTDVNGEFSLLRNVPGGACGAPLQVIDTSSCLVSNVAMVP